MKTESIAEDKLNVTQDIRFVFDRIKTLWEKKKILVPAFSPSPIIFSKGFLLGVVHTSNCVLIHLFIIYLAVKSWNFPV